MANETKLKQTREIAGVSLILLAGHLCERCSRRTRDGLVTRWRQPHLAAALTSLRLARCIAVPQRRIDLILMEAGIRRAAGHICDASKLGEKALLAMADSKYTNVADLDPMSLMDAFRHYLSRQRGVTRPLPPELHEVVEVAWAQWGSSSRVEPSSPSARATIIARNGDAFVELEEQVYAAFLNADPARARRYVSAFLSRSPNERLALRALELIERFENAQPFAPEVWADTSDGSRR